VTAAFFAGLSAGYVLSLRISERAFRWLFVGSTFMHLSFPVSYRYLAAWFASLELGGYAYLALLFGYALLFTAVFAAFLPRLITLEGDEDDQVSRLKLFYSIELMGFVSGFLVIALSWNRPLLYLLPVYWLVLALLLQLVQRRLAITATFAVAAVATSVYLPRTDFHSTALLYQLKHHMRNASVVYSVNSPYQKVEVIDSARGDRSLYLDGLQNLNSSDLESLNYYIAKVPARLIQPRHVLLVGNGTLSSVPKVYPYAQQVTSVELDPGVLQASRYFVPPARLRGLERWQLLVDDAKHYLRTHTQQFDLLIMDVPSPLTIQEAYLHTREFYTLARKRLGRQGVIAVQLSGKLQRNNRTPAQVVAALQQVFKQVMVVYSPRADRGFAYAADQLPFTTADIRRAAGDHEEHIRVIHPAGISRYLKEASALSVDNMDLVLRRGLERFLNRYFR
jgi:spermidine synthase